MYEFCEVTISGKLVRDVEIKTTASGTRFGVFTLAQNKSETETQYLDCTCTDKKADWLIKEGFGKGATIYVVGELDIKTYVSADGKPQKSINIRARKVQAGSKPKSQLEREFGSGEKKKEAVQAAEESFAACKSLCDSEIDFG